MSLPIQVMVADQWGLDVAQIQRLLVEHYISPHGQRVTVERGLGVYVDGVPEGTLTLKGRKE